MCTEYSLYNDFEPMLQELNEQINSLEIHVDRLKKTREALWEGAHANAPKGMRTSNYDRIGSRSNYVPYRLDRIVEKLYELDNEIETWGSLLQAKQETRERFIEILSRMDNISFKVRVMRDTLGMRLNEIAAKLGYSYEHIKRVSSKLKNRDVASGGAWGGST
jgi:dGTP triphosphohydrolase